MRSGLSHPLCFAFNFCNAHKLKLASLVHGGGWQKLESLLDLGRLGVE